MNTGYGTNHDCLGNVTTAQTVEGFCVRNIYAEACKAWFCQPMREHGYISRGDDGELHFYPERLLGV